MQVVERAVEPAEKKLCDEAEIVNGFCYLGNRLNTSGGYQTAETTRTRL